MRERARAKLAYDCVRAVPEGTVRDYAPPAKNLAASIRRNGLGQALVFVASKKDKKGMAVLCDHLVRQGRVTFSQGFDLDGLIKHILDPEKVSDREFRIAEAEFLAFGIWLKRFTEALLAEEAQPSGDAGEEDDEAAMEAGDDDEEAPGEE